MPISSLLSAGLSQGRIDGLQDLVRSARPFWRLCPPPGPFSFKHGHILIHEHDLGPLQSQHGHVFFEKGQVDGFGGLLVDDLWRPASPPRSSRQGRPEASVAVVMAG